MATIDDLQLATADGAAFGIKDLLSALVSLIERDAELRAYLAELIGAAGEPGPPGIGIAWVPDFAITPEGYLKVVHWFSRPANAGPPPTGILSESGIIPDHPDAYHRVGQLLSGLVPILIQKSGGDVEAARRYIEENTDVIAEVIMERVAAE